MKKIKLNIENGVTYANVEDLFLFKDNPRDVEAKDFQRLKDQIDLGEHSPLLVTTEGEVLGGNTRLRAYKELGKKTAKVVVVEIIEKAEDEVYILIDGKESPKVFDSIGQAKLELALSHNDSIGTNNELKLAELLTIYNIPTEIYSVSTKITPVEDILARVSPSDDDENPVSGEVNTDDLINEDKDVIVCPRCKFEIPKESNNEDEGN